MHEKTSHFNSTSNSFLNQYLMKCSLSLHYKRKHEKVCPTTPLKNTRFWKSIQREASGDWNNRCFSPLLKKSKTDNILSGASTTARSLLPQAVVKRCSPIAPRSFAAKRPSVSTDCFTTGETTKTELMKKSGEAQLNRSLLTFLQCFWNSLIESWKTCSEKRDLSPPEIFPYFSQGIQFYGNTVWLTLNNNLWQWFSTFLAHGPSF